MIDATAWAAVVLAALLGGVVGTALTGWVVGRRRGREVAALRAEIADVRHRLAELEAAPPVSGRPGSLPDRPPATATRAGAEKYVITGLVEDRAAVAAAPTVPATAFTDIVLRETAVRTASLAHGLRRALAPEVRNRIRFEVRREVRRRRKERRSDLRSARREWAAQQRATLDDRDHGSAA